MIGHGAMGTVYEARVLASGERVAIKWLHARAFAADDPDLLRFTQEARIASALDSPHMTTLVELARDPETQVPYLVMGLLRGEDVRGLLARVGPLRPDVAVRVAAQACAGLAAAHAAGVVHRDIKPENLFLARGEGGAVVVKVLDFGIAKIRRTSEHTGASAGLTAPAASMTRSGEVVGTPLFMAPELLDGPNQADGRSDVYSMGVTLYALLAGAPPHSGVESLVKLLYLVVNEPPPPLAQAAPWLPAGLIAIVEKTMAREKALRYRSAAEMLEALQPFLPEGAALREEMLVGVDDEQRRAAPVRAGSSRAPRDPARR